LNDLLIPGLTPWATDCRPLRGLETPSRIASESFPEGDRVNASLPDVGDRPIWDNRETLPGGRNSSDDRGRDWVCSGMIVGARPVRPINLGSDPVRHADSPFPSIRGASSCATRWASPASPGVLTSRCANPPADAVHGLAPAGLDQEAARVSIVGMDLATRLYERPRATVEAGPRAKGVIADETGGPGMHGFRRS
jgi:hypothetical protein